MFTGLDVLVVFGVFVMLMQLANPPQGGDFKVEPMSWFVVAIVMVLILSSMG